MFKKSATTKDKEDERIRFYLEKTFSQNPSDVAHLLKFLYYPIIRFDTKNWFYFVDHRWNRRDEDQSPLIGLMKNDLVNRYLSLANRYNEEVMKLTRELNVVQDLDSMDSNLNVGLYGDSASDDDSQGDRKDLYLPLIISDLMYKSMICSELSLKLSNHGYYHKVNTIAQELFTQKDFELRLDLNPELLGFNNGNYHLQPSRLRVPVENDRVFMTVGYHFRSDNMSFRKDIEDFWNRIGLKEMLPVLASLLRGNVRQPLIWVDGLNDRTSYAISQLLQGTLGDYIGSLPFSTLRKRKIPHYQNHTHTALVESFKKRLIIVDQTPEDYPALYPPMIETLLGRHTLNLRKPYETTNDYIPQFGIIILSSKSDSEPSSDALVFKENVNLKKNTDIENY